MANEGGFGGVYLSLPDIWEANAACQPDKEAVVCGDRRLNWKQFNEAINRIANALKRDGIGRGDRVAVLMSNSIENLVIMFGSIKAGACTVPLSPMLTTDQLAVLLRDCEPSIAFLSDATRKLAKPITQERAILPENRWIAVGFDAPGWRRHEDFIAGAGVSDPGVSFIPDDDFVVIYSSGTTGLPKGIRHSHFSRHELASACALEMRFDHAARALTTTSLYSMGTFLMLLPTFLVGGTLIVLEQFSPQTMLEAVERERITHTFLVPSQFLAILADARLDGSDLSSLRCMLSAGSPLRGETKREILARMGPGLYELYGTSEGIASMMKPEQREGRMESAGPPMIGHQLKIIDNDGNELPSGELGEIVGRSSSLMKEYYNKSVETAAAIWHDTVGRAYFRTGDIGRLDANQFVTIVDRKKDMIISGGFNVFPVDIEAAIGAHEAVFDVTVIGVPHPKWDETPLALVILREGAVIGTDALKEWANQRLARHQRVSAVEFRSEFPRNALGKVMKRLLREPYWKRSDS